MIGARLRAVRTERAGLTLEDAARLLGSSMATLSRTENGLRHITSEEVATLVTAYGMPADERAEFISDARWDNPSCVWERLLPGLPLDAVFASYLDEANTLTDWSVSLVPRLLQIEDYALAVMRSTGLSPEGARRRWRATKKQQARLGTVDYTAYLGETALYRPFGGPAVHRDQLAHLHSLHDRGIGLRIVPEHLPVELVSHSWLHMTFPNTSPMVTVTAFDNNFYLHNDQALLYDRQLTLLNKIALPAPSSRDKIGAIMDCTV
ncbi:MAG TPA: helix-turn-helix transcriptional regulator [Actinophytocola sp.]|jgi:transcriptional regulator with XRE-family HTH domain|nr:helix-turn-helix transcriptional regulator [Actinophytocola sp.]